MIDIKRRKVKAVYHNAFCCPECGLELHRDRTVLTTYPAQYCYFCDCGFRTTSTQLPGYEVEFEENDQTEWEKMVDRFNEIPLSFLHTTDPAIVEPITYNLKDFTVSTGEAVENIKVLQQTLSTMMKKELSYV